MASSSAPAWIAFAASMFALVANVAITAWQRHDDSRQKLLEQRRDALFTALEVIDHVYANTGFDSLPPANPHKWPIAQARKAMNGMLVYCEDPSPVIDHFRRAIGLYNPSTEAAPRGEVKQLNAFRDDVCRELGLPPLKSCDPNFTWIYSLAGGE
ncbi:MAG: hypothetical protein ACHQPI_02870 [Thermoanaerobaculia bacterium]